MLRGDGRWQAVLNLGVVEGRRKRLYFYDATEKIVIDQITLAKAKMLRGAPFAADRRRTVGTFLDEWVSGIKSSVRVRTYEKYRGIVKKHLTSHLGRIRLEKLAPTDAQRLLDLKISEGLHPRTVQSIRAVLSYALNDAIRWDLTARNAASLVRSPKVPQREMQVWTEEQARKFLECCTGKRLGALYLLALFTGLRRGELCGLRWSDIDLDTGTLTVGRSLQRSCTQGLIFQEPKTLKGRRTVSLASAVVTALRNHRERQLEKRLAAGPAWKEQDLVFPTGIGTPLDLRAVALDYERIVKKAELPRIRLHDLRHTFATLGLSKNVHPRVMSEMLGHSKVALTLDVYSHALPSLQVDAADKIAEALTSR